MEKLFQLTLILAVTLIAFGLNAQAQDNCSLVVKLVDVHDKEVTSPIPVTLKEENGRVSQAKYRIGGLRFCGLGILPVTLIVGSPYCHEITIRNVPVGLTEPRTTKVIADNEACSDGSKESLPLPFCRMLIRFVDQQDAWLPEVSIDPPAPITGLRRTDLYGRLLVTYP